MKSNVDISLQNRYLLALIFVTVGVVGLYFRYLEAVSWPLQNDEAVHLYRSWVLATKGTYHYTPWTHGPFLYYFSAAVLPVVGWKIVAARVILSVLSMSGLLGLYWLRHQLSTVTVTIAAILYGIHHYTVWIAAYYRQDALLAAVVLVWLGVAALYVERPTKYRALSLGGLGALSIGFKEMAFPIAFALFASLGVWYLVNHGFNIKPGRAYIDEYGDPLWWGIPLGGSIVLIALFTGMPPTVNGIVRVPIKVMWGPYFWAKSPMSGDVQNYTIFLEWLARTPIVFGLSIVGAGAALIRQRLVPLAVTVLFGGLLFLFSVLTKQVPRLTVYLAVPMFVLVGYAVEYALSTRLLTATTRKRYAVVGAVILLVFAVPASALGMQSVHTLDQDWGYDYGQSEVLTEVEEQIKSTGCSVHLIEGTLNHQVTRWYLREYTDRIRWTISKQSLRTKPLILIGESPVTLEYKTESTTVNGVTIFWPQSGC